MKALISSLALLASVAVLNAKPVYIHGTIRNLEMGTKGVIYYKVNNVEHEYESAAEMFFDSKGNFTARFNLDVRKEMTMDIGDERANLFIIPGDSLVFTVDYKEFDSTLTFSGRGAENNQYLQLESMQNFQAGSYAYNTIQTEKELVHYYDSLEAAHYNFFTTHSAGLSPEFAAFQKTNILCQYIQHRCMWTYAFVPEKGAYFQRDLSPNYFDFMNKVTINDPVNYDAYEHYWAVHNIFQYKYDHTLRPKGDTTRIAPVKWVEHEFKNRETLLTGKVREFHLTEYMYELLRGTRLTKAEMKPFIDRYFALCKDETYNEIIKKSYANFSRLSPGEMAPDFEVNDMTGQLVKLSDLKGKYVLIDFWNTGCGPCLMAMPKGQKLVEKYASRSDVAIVMLSLNDDPKVLKDYVKDEKLKGNVWLANSARTKEIQTLYNFRAIPRYVLIDKEGKIVNSAVFSFETGEMAIDKALQ